MEEKSYEVSGENVSKLVPMVRETLSPEKEYGGAGVHVMVGEMRGKGQEVVTVTVVVDRLDETTCHVEVIVGGDNPGLLSRSLSILETSSERILDKVRSHLERGFDRLELAVRPDDRSWDTVGSPDDEDRTDRPDRADGPGRLSGGADADRSRASGAATGDPAPAYPEVGRTHRCDACGMDLEAVGFDCDHCRGLFCREHRTPDDHDCVGNVSLYTTVELDSG